MKLISEWIGTEKGSEQVPQRLVFLFFSGRFVLLRHEDTDRVACNIPMSKNLGIFSAGALVLENFHFLESIMRGASSTFSFT